MFKKVLVDKIKLEAWYYRYVVNSVTPDRIKSVINKYLAIPKLENVTDEIERIILTHIIYKNFAELKSISDDAVDQIQKEILVILNPQNRSNTAMIFIEKCVENQNLNIYRWIFNNVPLNSIHLCRHTTLQSKIITSKNSIMLDIYLKYVKAHLDEYAINELFRKITEVNDAKILKTFLTHATVKFSSCDLIMGCKFGNLHLVKILLNRGFNPSYDKNLPFIYACYYNHLNVVNHLLTYPQVDPTDRNNEAYTLSLRNGHTEIIQRLKQDERIHGSVA